MDAKGLHVSPTYVRHLHTNTILYVGTHTDTLELPNKTTNKTTKKMLVVMQVKTTTSWKDSAYNLIFPLPEKRPYRS
jgi:hypothetical protein